MAPHERTPSEQAWLHVIECEVQVMAQVIRLGELISMRKDTTEAVAVFHVLEDELRILYEALKSKQVEAARRQR